MSSEFHKLQAIEGPAVASLTTCTQWKELHRCSHGYRRNEEEYFAQSSDGCLYECEVLGAQCCHWDTETRQCHGYRVYDDISDIKLLDTRNRGEDPLGPAWDTTWGSLCSPQALNANDVHVMANKDFQGISNEDQGITVQAGDNGKVVEVNLHKGYLLAHFNMHTGKRKVLKLVTVELKDFPKLWIIEATSTPEKLQHLLKRMKAGVFRDSSKDARRTSTGSTQEGYRPSTGLRPWTAEQAWILPQGHPVLVRCSELLCTKRGRFGYYYHGVVATQDGNLITVDVTSGTENGPYAGERIQVDAGRSDLPIVVPERPVQGILKKDQIVWVDSKSAGRWVRAKVTFVNGADVYLVYLDWLARGTPRKYDDETISLEKPAGAFYVGQKLRVKSQTDGGLFMLAEIVALSPQVVPWRSSDHTLQPSEIMITYLEGKHVDPRRQTKMQGDLKILVPITEGDQKNIMALEATRQLPLPPEDRHVSLSSPNSPASHRKLSSSSSSSSSVSQATVKCHELQTSTRCDPVADSNMATEARVVSQPDCLRFCEDKNAACCMMVPVSPEKAEWTCTVHTGAVLTKGAENEFGSACGDEDTMAAVHATPRRVPRSKCGPLHANHECPQASSSYVLVLPPGDGNCLQLCPDHGAHCCQWVAQKHECIGRWYREKSIIGLIVSGGRQASMCEPEGFESGKVYRATQSFSVMPEPYQSTGYYVEENDQGEVLQVDVEGNAMLDFEEALGRKWVPLHDLAMFKKMTKQASRRSSNSVDSSLVQLSDEFQESELGLVELLSDGNASSWRGGGTALEVALDPHGRQLAFRSKAEAHNR